LLEAGIFVNLTIYSISADLLHECSKYVIKPFYPGGISAAIMDLMRKAVKEQKQKKETE
jgi:hypothetical protein